MTVTRLLKAGDRILAGDDIYGGASRLLSRVVPKQGISVTNCDMASLAAVEAALTSDVKLLFVESPTNPRLQISDIRGICALAAKVGAKVCVDNSIMAPGESDSQPSYDCLSSQQLT